MRKKIIIIPTILLIALSCNNSNSKNNDSTLVTKDSNNPYAYDYGIINPKAPEETIEFGQFVGLWNCISKDLVKDENGNDQWYTNKAFWKWEYILGGHALLNNWWQEDNSPNPITKEYFASGIFIFNPETLFWEITVMNSRPHKLSSKFQASYRNGEITMRDGTGKWKVTFFDIKENSFEWKYEILSEYGTWKPISFINARRQS